MIKVIVDLKKGENLHDKMTSKMKKISSKGHVIKVCGFDWFMYDEEKQINE